MTGPCEFVVRRDRFRRSPHICAKPGKRAAGKFWCSAHYPAVIDLPVRA